MEDIPRFCRRWARKNSVTETALQTGRFFSSSLLCWNYHFDYSPAFLPGRDHHCSAAHYFQTLLYVIQRKMRSIVICRFKADSVIRYNDLISEISF